MNDERKQKNFATNEEETLGRALWGETKSRVLDPFRANPMQRTFETIALLGAVLAFIFSFFVGLSLAGNGLTEIPDGMIDLSVILNRFDLSYFLWEGYEIFFFSYELNANTAFTFIVLILNTLFCLVAIIPTGYFAVKTLLKYINILPFDAAEKGGVPSRFERFAQKNFKLAPPDRKNIFVEAGKAWMFYAVGATVLLALSSIAVKNVNFSVSQLSLTFNTATLTGLILSGVCLLIAGFGNLLNEKVNSFTKKRALGLFFTAGAFIAAIAAFFLLGGAALGFTVPTAYGEISMSMNFLGMLGLATSESGFNFEIDGMIGTIIGGIGGTLVHCALFAMLAVELYAIFSAFAEKQTPALKNFAIISAIVALLYVVFAIISAVSFKILSLGTAIEGAESVFWLPVVIFVLTVICAVFASLAQKSFAAQTGIPNGGANLPAVGGSLPTSQPNDGTQVNQSIQTSGVPADQTDRTDGTDAARDDET